VFPELKEVEEERDIKLQGRVLMKMIIPKQDKVKRLLMWCTPMWDKILPHITPP
jgi:hypothetical protein